MRIFAYQASEPDAPSGAWMARIWDTVQGRKGPRTDWLPIIFSGPTEGAARLRAQVWYDKELEKVEGKRQRGAALGAKKTPEPEDFDVL